MCLSAVRVVAINWMFVLLTCAALGSAHSAEFIDCLPVTSGVTTEPDLPLALLPWKHHKDKRQAPSYMVAAWRRVSAEEISRNARTDDAGPSVVP